MGISELYLEHQDFILETYRHASRYGDSPCDYAFLPRRGIFFWPMEKSELDQRRFHLWARMLKRMEKDKILVPVEEKSTNNDIRDARYFFHPSQFRPPYYKNHKIHWPHVKEWYFEFMNGKEETHLLKEAMDHLEKYLDSRDKKEDSKAFNPTPKPKANSKPLNLPLIQRSDEIHNHRDPKHPLINGYRNNTQLLGPIENRRVLESPINTIPPLSEVRDNTALINSFVSANNRSLCEESPAIQSRQKITTSEFGGQNGRLITCSGCPRCNYKIQFPDDLFEGKILHYGERTQPAMGCEYIICQECMKVYNLLESKNIKEHLESPEHTRNVLLRLQKTGRKPTETTDTKHRLVTLDIHAKLHGYDSAKDYITRSPPMLSENTKLTPFPSDVSSCSIKTIPNDLSVLKLATNFDEYEVKTPELLPSEEELHSSKSSAGKEKNTSPDNLNRYEQTTQDLSRCKNLDDKLNLLYTQQCKTSKILGLVEGDVSRAQDSLKDISRQVQNSTGYTEDLTQSFLKHDAAIKLLQKDSTQGKAMSSTIEESINGMMGNVNRETLTNRLEQQGREIIGLRTELKNKVDDVNYWLKVIDRHTNDINSLKQNAWINGQMNNRGESNLVFAEKFEYQLHAQEQATRNFMLQMEQRFNSIIKQYADEINILRQMDEEKQRQILTMKAQFGLKFAHLEQKQASMRKSKRYA